MLSLALFTPNADTAYCVEQMAEESRQFNLVINESPIPPVAELVRLSGASIPK
jgi:hypothetical protein